MMAQHITFTKAIKPVKILIIYLYFYWFYGFAKSYMLAIIFIARIRFPPGKSLATILIIILTRNFQLQ